MLNQWRDDVSMNLKAPNGIYLWQIVHTERRENWLCAAEASENIFFDWQDATIHQKKTTENYSVECSIKFSACLSALAFYSFSFDIDFEAVNSPITFWSANYLRRPNAS